MAIGSGLLVLAILAAPQEPSGSAEGGTTFSVRVLTLDGLEWRTSSYSRLQPVSRQGPSTVWTADRTLADSLAERARSNTNFGKVVSATNATLTKTEAVNYVASVERFANGPINQSSAIAFLPRPERMDERFAVKLSGRPLDQGILTQVWLEETHVEILHTIPQSENVLPTDPKVTRTGGAGVGREIVNALLAPRASEKAQSITCSVQVPEVSHAKVEGEWLIPTNGVLLMSLGVKTVADDQGKAVVRERVAVIEANPLVTTTEKQLGSTEPAPIDVIPVASTRLAVPRLPSRSLPLPIDRNGDVVEGELPPLPEALASTDLDQIKPAPYLPSPQTLPRLATPTRDFELARTSYEPLATSESAPTYFNDFNDAKPSTTIALLEKILFALEQAGVTIDSKSPVLKSIKPACEKCEEVDADCPAFQGSAVKQVVTGEIKSVPETAALLGISVNNPKGSQSFQGMANLSDALKNPGKTETTFIPMGGKLLLEIKATVVSGAPENKPAMSTSKTSGLPTRR